jgi:hypothetical protein
MAAVTVDKVERLWDMLHDENFSYMYRHPDLLKLAKDNKNAAPFRVASPFILSDTGYIVPTFLWAYGFETADGYVSMYSGRYHNFWDRVLILQGNTDRLKRFPKNSSAVYLFGNPTDRGPTCPDEGEGWGMSCSVAFEKDYDLALLSLANVRYVISARLLTSPHLRLLPSDMRHRLIERQGSRLRERLSSKLAGEYVGPPLYIYENEMAFPRFFLAGGVSLFDNEASLLSALSKASMDGLRNTVFIRRDDLKTEELTQSLEKVLPQGAPEGTVKIVQNDRDEIVLSIETDKPQVFVAANNYSPFWQADLDGHPWELFPVYNTFQGVLIPAGSHTLTLRYLPPYSPKAYLP